MAFTGIPASVSFSMVLSRWAVVVVLGSRSLLVSGFREVMEICTPTSPYSCKAVKRSRSRRSRAFLVMMPTGCRYLRKTSRQALVIRKVRSAG